MMSWVIVHEHVSASSAGFFIPYSGDVMGFRCTCASHQLTSPVNAYAMLLEEDLNVEAHRLSYFLNSFAVISVLRKLLVFYVFASRVGAAA